VIFVLKLDGKIMIEAVIVCVDYADFLCWTLPFNRHQFDNTVVVTSTKDIKTQKLCEYWHVKCIRTDVCYEDGGFNKGKMINEGLDHVSGKEWVVHMDSDIFLPPHFRRMFNCAELDLDSLYTMDRMMCKDFKQWIQYLAQPKIQYENEIFIHPGPFEHGVRLAGRVYGGYMPIGFFQMWHQGAQQLTYPTEHTSAARGDVQFSLKFPRSKRNLFAECYCIHLETVLPENKEMGANWNGRKTPVFGEEFLNAQPQS